jgi:hypothetical protein
MADYSCIYTLTTPGPDIIFNNGQFGYGSLDDLYWLDNVHGLDGPSLRVNSEDVPFGHGGIVQRSWKGPRHPVLEGRLIVQSVGLGGCQAVLNDMEEELRTALDAILAPASGTLAWTPSGGSPHSLTVYVERTVDYQPADGYRTRSFDFGLISESADI